MRFSQQVCAGTMASMPPFESGVVMTAKLPGSPVTGT